jgi:hypothetical protein
MSIRGTVVNVTKLPDPRLQYLQHFKHLPLLNLLLFPQALCKIGKLGKTGIGLTVVGAKSQSPSIVYARNIPLPL